MIRLFPAGGFFFACNFLLYFFILAGKTSYMLLKIVKLLGFLLGINLLVILILIVLHLPGTTKIDKIYSHSFEFERDVIIVKAYLKGIGPYNFILDTGTDPCVIDRELAERLSFVQFSLGKQEVGENQPIEISLPSPLKLRLGDMPESRKFFLGFDLKPISQKMGMPIHGILGHNFLQDNAFQIDYKQKEIHFFPPEHEIYPEVKKGVLAMNLQFIDKGSFPLIDELRINGRKIRVTLDTGYNQSLTLYKEAIKELKLERQLKELADKTSLGYGGEKKVKSLAAHSLQLHNWNIPQKRNLFADLESKKSEVPMEIRAGNMGNGILKHYKLSMDYKQKKVWFEKH
ncbi:MAG: aspartyl protease family protein [Bacteroidota bacterium]